MKLTVTVFSKEDQYGVAQEEEDIEFENVSSWEIIGEFFIVLKEDGSIQAIREYKVRKFFTTI